MFCLIFVMLLLSSIHQYLSDEVKYLLNVISFVLQSSTDKCCYWLAISYHLTNNMLIWYDLCLIRHSCMLFWFKHLIKIASCWTFSLTWSFELNFKQFNLNLRCFTYQKWPYWAKLKQLCVSLGCFPLTSDPFWY